jgi:hypothetical protein
MYEKYNYERHAALLRYRPPYLTNSTNVQSTPAYIILLSNDVYFSSKCSSELELLLLRMMLYTSVA